MTLTKKRKYVSEDDQGDGYKDVECPDCGAVFNLHFQRGRNWRRTRCPICLATVTINLGSDDLDPPLIRLERGRS